MSHSQKGWFHAVGCILMAVGIVVASSEKAGADWQSQPTLSVGISEHYDDNIASEQKGKLDLVTVLKTRAELALIREVTTLSFGASTALQFYSKNSKFNKPSYTGFADWARTVSRRTSLAVQESIRYSPEAVEFLDIRQREAVDGSDEASVSISIKRTDQIDSSTRVSASQKITERTSGQVHYSANIRGFKDPTLFDSVTHSGRATLRYALDRSTTVSSAYGYTYVDNREGNDPKVHQGSLGVSRDLSDSTTLNGTASLNYAIEATGSTGTAGGTVSLTNNLGELMRLGIVYTSSVSPTPGLSSDLVRFQTAKANLSRSLTRDSVISLGGHYGTSRSISSNRIRIKAWGLSARIGYTIFEWLRANLDYSHGAQQSTGQAGNGFKRNQYSAGLSAVFD